MLFLSLFSDVKSAIKDGRDTNSFNTVVNGLKSKELDLVSSKDSNHTSGGVMHVRGRSQHRFKSMNNFSQNFGKDKGRSKSRSKSKQKYRTCYKCGEKGHYMKECPRNRNNQSNNHANVASSSDNSGDVFVVIENCDASNFVSSSSLHDNEWLVDSGCTFHMSSVRNLFSNYREVSHGYVSMANEKQCQIVGIGDVCLKFVSGYVLTLKDVRHVPDLCNNQISCAALEDDGFQGR